MTNQLPEGITTALVHMDAPLSFIGDPGRLHVEISSSTSLVWAATGTPIANFDDSMDLSEGQALEIVLPHTDQSGFLDNSGNAITGWFYTVNITYEKEGQTRVFPERDFQIPAGQTDVDLALVPSGSAYVPQVAPILPVTSVNGRNGSVTLAKSDVGLALVDNTSDAAKPVSTAAQAALNLKAPLASPTFTGTVSGVSAAMVGLGNVDNTSDSAKPVSTATNAALNLKAPLANPTFTGTVSGVTAGMVGLGNVNNTSDAAKPVSTATQTALNLKADLASPTFTGTVNGITKSMVGLGSVDNTSDASKPVSTAQQTALNLKANLASPTFTGTVSGITAGMVGLGNVNNTADSAKPVSTAQQTALDLKLNVSARGAANGVASLDAAGFIPPAQQRGYTNKVSITVTAQSGNTANVTFPVGMFTAIPVVLATKQDGGLAKYIAYATNITASGCTIGIFSGDGTSASGTSVVGFRAFSMD
jgi:hypothetical protein